MQDIFILNLETSSTVCSVSISKNGRSVFLKEENNGYTHAENLHTFIQEAFNASGLKAKELAAIAVSMGPGSYTGLRIGISSAKGLCYTLEKPLIGVFTLEALAWRTQSLTTNKDFYFCPMIDARRMEVYTATYTASLDVCEHYQAKIITEDSIRNWNKEGNVIYFGSGMNKCRQLLQKKENAFFADDILPSAAWMEEISYKKFLLKEFEDLAYSEPFYGKEFQETGNL